MYLLPGGSGTVPHSGIDLTVGVTTPVASLVSGTERVGSRGCTCEDLVTGTTRLAGTVAGVSPTSSWLGHMLGDSLVHSPGSTAIAIYGDAVVSIVSMSPTTVGVSSRSWLATHAVPDCDPVCSWGTLICATLHATVVSTVAMTASLTCTTGTASSTLSSMTFAVTANLSLCLHWITVSRVLSAVAVGNAVGSAVSHNPEALFGVVTTPISISMSTAAKSPFPCNKKVGVVVRKLLTNLHRKFIRG